MRKYYILDANILIHDPNSIFEFADNAVIIPIGVINELDAFKKEMSARGYNARAVVRRLDALRNGQSLATGVSLDNGGTLRVYCEPENVLSTTNVGNGSVDLEILRVADAIRRDDPDTPVIVVTKDINLRVRADAAGIRAEDYETDQVRLDDLYSGQTTWTVPTDTLAAFRKGDPISATEDRPADPNQYILLQAEFDPRNTALARADAEGRCVLPLQDLKEGICGIKPRNKEQYFAFDALVHDEIQLVTLMGKAGTGKTLLAIAAAIHLAVRLDHYRGVLICRPTVPVGRDLGYLPGDIGEKLDPWMKPIIDIIEFLIDVGGPIKGQTDCAGLLRSGLIEIQPLTYIRGRNIANRYVVIDEAQNLAPLEVKTIITRMGQAAKVVLTGDPCQIDNPYVDTNSNGFTYLVNRFRTQPIAAHIELHKGERSQLAELAANLL